MSQAFAPSKVAIFRALEDAPRTAARLAARGFEAIIAPVIAPVALGTLPPSGRFDAVAVTSARALDLASPALAASIAGVPLYVVGDAGEAAAARRGLSVAASALDAASLAGVLVAALSRGSRVLYLAGVDRKPDLEGASIRNGFSFVTLEVYDARARDDWTAAERQAVASCRAALHYSRRGVELALALVERAEIRSQWRAMAHVAISGDAASPLGAGDGMNVIVAAAPREEAMFEALERALGDESRAG